MKSSFEELPNLLGKSSTPRFVSLGLTFSNYAPQDILTLLKNIAGENSFVFINAQMRDRVDMAALQKVYQEDGEHLADDKLKLLGLDPETDVSPRIADDGFRVWCSIIKGNAVLDKAGVKEGDQLMVFESLRYTKDDLENEIKKTFSHYKLFDTGVSFIATLART